MKLFLTLFSIVVIVSNVAADDKKLSDYAVPVVQNWLSGSSDVVEVCVFKEEWRSPTKNFPKGVLLKFATITRVHKGSVKVGEKIVLTYMLEYDRDEWIQVAKIHPDRISIGSGSLMISMFSKVETQVKVGYRYVGDDISRFEFDTDFYRAFLLEKKRDGKLQGIKN